MNGRYSTNRHIVRTRRLEPLYRHDRWNVGIARGSGASLPRFDPRGVRWLRTDVTAGYIADPFLIEEGGTTYCFFEAFPYASERGKIAYAILDDPSPRTRVIDAIVADHHLSYPLLLREGGEIICVPEASASGNVTAYVARAFPTSWQERATLISGFAGVDNTLVRRDGLWWLFATDAATHPNRDLHIFFATSLFGPWRAHARNPVKRDLRGSRPAGNFFEADGSLLRPAQDCSARYGARIVVNEILELTPDRFAEREVSTIEPQPGAYYRDGLHHIDRLGHLVAIDGNRCGPVPLLAFRAARRGVNKVKAKLFESGPEV